MSRIGRLTKLSPLNARSPGCMAEGTRGCQAAEIRGSRPVTKVLRPRFLKLWVALGAKSSGLKSRIPLASYVANIVLPYIDFSDLGFVSRALIARYLRTLVETCRNTIDVIRTQIS